MGQDLPSATMFGPATTLLFTPPTSFSHSQQRDVDIVGARRWIAHYGAQYASTATMFAVGTESLYVL